MQRGIELYLLNRGGSMRQSTAGAILWAGIHSEASMRHYAIQMEPLMSVLLAKGYDNVSVELAPRIFGNSSNLIYNPHCLP